jgi:hypothetical protein
LDGEDMIYLQRLYLNTSLLKLKKLKDYYFYNFSRSCHVYCDSNIIHKKKIPHSKYFISLYKKRKLKLKNESMSLGSHGINYS